MKIKRKNYVKTALVTGGAEGIGRAVVLRLAEDGYAVVVNYKDAKTRRQAVALGAELKKKKREHLIFRADITKENEVKALFAKIKDKYGLLGALVNNAGINQTESFELLNFNNFDKIIDTNLRGAMLVTKYSLPLLKKSSAPRIIFISSVNSFIGSPHRASYVVSKSGIVGLTRALAVELAPKILVNAVVPGYIDTNMFWKFSRGPLKEKIKRIPLQRLGKPEEVASVVSFLCSHDAPYITGQSIHVNGGLYLN